MGMNLSEREKKKKYKKELRKRKRIWHTSVVLHSPRQEGWSGVVKGFFVGWGGRGRVPQGCRIVERNTEDWWRQSPITRVRTAAGAFSGWCPGSRWTPAGCSLCPRHRWSGGSSSVCRRHSQCWSAERERDVTLEGPNTVWVAQVASSCSAAESWGFPTSVKW